PFWSSLSASANGGVYYQLFGAAPRRYLVVQWDDLYMWRSGDIATFQAILFEGSDIIKFQYQWLTTDYLHAVGIENKDASDGITYNTCGLSGQVYDGRAVLFLPLGSAYGPISADITFAAQTAASLPVNSWITNTVAITAFGGLFEFERRAETLVNPVSLISSTKSVDKAAAGMGETLTYRLNLTNTGLLAARGAQLTDTLPAALTFVSGSLSCSSGACGYSSGLVTWEGSVTPTRPVTLTYRATLNRLLPNRSPVVNTARLHNGSGTYHTLTATFTARAPDLGASTIQAEPAQVLAGEAVTYTIYIFNAGEFATPAQLAATLPPSLTYRSSSLVCGRGTCAFHNGTVIWAGTAYLRSLIPVRFQAQTPGWAAVGQVITSTAAITDLTGGAGLTLTATVTITGAADLWVSKTGPGVAAPGGALVYTIHHGNRGPYHASFPAQVIDHLPPGAAYLGSKPPGVYSPTAHSVTWDATALGTGGGTLGTFGSLAPGISGTLVVTAAAPVGSGLLPYLLTNTAVITTPPSDPDGGNNTARYVTIIGGQVNLLESSKTVAPQQAAQGDALTYTITLKNSGAITATTRITDPLPAGTGFVAGSGTVDGVGAALYNQTRRQVEWQGPVAPGKTVILRFQAQITTPLGIQLTNRVVVSDGVWMTVYRQATARALPVTPAKYSTYLPLVLKK
ncbi:MAG: hypothetical protein ACE5G8_07645, partial [Anaerolineae bacterium]